MKLKNKKTGEIKEFALFDGNELQGGATLESLTKQWEDYEEPKLFYVVDLDGEILLSDFEDKTIEKAKELGNYFETDEEAEKAVEKLKAWKRLKDKGFKFDRYTEGKIDFSLDKEYSEYTYDGYDEGCEFYVNNEVECDLDLLFGGKE